MKIKGIENEIKGAIFDMDGLLVNSEQLYWDANIQAAHEYRLGIPDDSYLKLVGSSAREMETFYHRHFQTTKQRDAFIKRTDDLVWQWADEGKLKLNPGVKETLELLAGNNIKMGIASSNYQKYVEKFIRVTGIEDYFSFYLSYQDVQDNNLKPKPAPDIYNLAQEKINLPKENLLVFEDSSTGVSAAKNAGLNCVMVPGLKPASQTDKKNASLICDSFFDFLNRIG